MGKHLGKRRFKIIIGKRKEITEIFLKKRRKKKYKFDLFFLLYFFYLSFLFKFYP